MLTRVFKSGNSMAVRIPKELAFSDNIQEVEIERIGNTLVVRPVEAQTLADVMDICAMFTPDFMADGRDESPEAERDWEAFGGPAGGKATADS
jgi:antitoxin VapB